MYYIGLDLGQAADYSALSVIQRVGDGYAVRHLQRYKLGLPYPAIAEHVKGLISTPALKEGAALIVDQTGVGRPVVDILLGLRLAPIGITISGGNTVSHDPVKREYVVPKRDLVSNLQVLLQAQRLKFAEGMPEVPALINELMAFKVKISAAGHDTYGNDWREAAHDDMVLSVAMACWYAEKYGRSAEVWGSIYGTNGSFYRHDDE